MILLNRKRLILILFGITLSITTFLFFTASSKNTEVIQTVALPVSNKVIVLDAGHGVPDERCSK